MTLILILTGLAILINICSCMLLWIVYLQKRDNSELIRDGWKYRNRSESSVDRYLDRCEEDEMDFTGEGEVIPPGRKRKGRS
jgi:hypothetical protein